MVDNSNLLRSYPLAIPDPRIIILSFDRSKPEIVTSPSEPTTSFPLATAS